MKASITIIGFGRLGKLLHDMLFKAGYDQISVIRKNDEILFLNDYIIIAVPDDNIPTVIEDISQSGLRLKSKIIAHTSGVVGLDVFSTFNQKKVTVGCFHPLMAITETSKSFDGITFDVCGDVKFVRTIKPIIDDLDGKTLVVDDFQKATLHLAAVISSNYLVTLMGMVEELFENSEIDQQQIKKAMIPLMQSALRNLENQSPSEALTGPIARGDYETIQKHLNLLVEKTELNRTYRRLGKETIRLLGKESTEEIKTKLLSLFDEQ